MRLNRKSRSKFVKRLLPVPAAWRLMGTEAGETFDAEKLISTVAHQLEPGKKVTVMDMTEDLRTEALDMFQQYNATQPGAELQVLEDNPLLVRVTRNTAHGPVPNDYYLVIVKMRK